MIKKIRPMAKLAQRSDSDGWHSLWDIDYFCPVCHRKIRDYKSDVACDECGTFYDWRSSSPEVITKNELVWDGEVVDMIRN